MSESITKLHSKLMKCLDRENYFGERKAICAKALSLTPKNAEEWAKMGFIYDRIKRSNEAIFCFEEALKLEPSNIQFLQDISSILFDNSYFRECVPYLERLSEIEPELASNWSLLAFCRLRIGQYAKAKSLFKKALELDEQNATANFDLGMFLKHLRFLEVFTVGYNVVDVDSAVIHNLNEIIEFEASSYSQQPTFYFVLNPKTEEIQKLIESPRVRCVVNTRENVENLANGTKFVFYNKKSKTFVNYEPEKQDLSFERHLISSYPDKQLLLDEMIKIKSLATRIYLQLNEKNNADYFPELLRDYDQTYWGKILNFTRLYYDIEIPNFNRPKQLPRKKASSKPEKDYSAEYDAIMKVNRKIGQKFIQLINDYRFEKVNPANLEVRQLFYPRKLYNYLRNHHWEKGIPQEFVREWIRATIKDFSLTENDHMEFQMTLNKLDLPYSLPEFDAERGSKPVAASPSHLKRESPTQIVRKVSGPKTIPSPVGKNRQVKKVKQVGSNSIPPIENFREFRLWIVKKLDELENIL